MILPLRKLSSGLLTAVAALVVTLSSTHAQVVSSAVNGIVRDTSGKEVAGASIVARHEPTGTTYSAISRADGTYSFRSMIVGGPYSIRAEAPSFNPESRTAITTELGSEIDVNFTLKPSSDVVQMEKLTVESSANDLDSGMTGAGSVLTRQQIEVVPTVQRSFADSVSKTPLVTLRLLSGDRQEAQISAVGMNNRFNSIQLDGARINDQFGLNGTGLASFFNPISLDTIEQFSVQISPYDVRQSGFTGASINAVTKSGTNTFHGTAYAIYGNGSLSGNDNFGPTIGTRPPLQRRTTGFTLGGPIWQNHLFFFVAYEKFVQDSTPSQTGLVPDSASLSQVVAGFNAINAAAGKNYNWGNFSTVSSNRANETKRLAKIDWNITNDQRLSIRYSDEKGSVPQFGKYSTTGSFTGVLGGGGPSASAGTALDSNFYAQGRKEKVFASQLLSQWTPDLKTEVRYSRTKQDQATPTNSTLPEVRIFGIGGINQSGATIANGVLVAGTEQFRQGNEIHVKTDSYSGTADYTLGSIDFSGGFDREKSDFYNLFRAGSYGLVDYSSITNFLADSPTAFSRSYYASGTPAADVSNFGITGLFGQAKWTVNPRFSVTAGARIDFVQSSRSPFNSAFFNSFGVRNDGSVGGTQTASPRVSFNYALDQARKTQIRGGLGYFIGRAPWVFFSNSYSNSGVGRFLDLSQPTGGLGGYLKNSFDPAAPIGVAPSDPGFPATPNPSFRRDINLIQDKLHLPSVIRGNIAVDHKLGFWDTVVSVEYVKTYQDKALFSDNLALQNASTGADGRPIFRQSAFLADGTTVDVPLGSPAPAGNKGVTSNTKDFNFNNVIRVRNVSAGQSAYGTISIDRAMKDHWAYNLSYTRGSSTEAQSVGQTVALDGWTRNAVFNQNSVEIRRSDFEVRNRVQATLAHEFVFAHDWKTNLALYYEGHTGSPYSFTYSNDMNRDGVAGNDLVYVPAGPGVDDKVVDYSAMSASQIASMMAFINSSEIGRFKGGVAPRNAFFQQWQNRLDLHVSQEIPVYHPLKVEVFADFINFGNWVDHHLFNYTEVLNTGSSGVYYRRFLGSATYAADGRILPTYSTTPADATIDNIQSRWRIQIGARIMF